MECSKHNVTQILRYNLKVPMGGFVLDGTFDDEHFLLKGYGTMGQDD